MDRFVSFRVIPFLAAALILMGASTAVSAEAADDAKAVIESTSKKLICAIHNSRGKKARDPANLRGQVEAILAPHFDAIAMSRLALGDHWGNASREQKIDFTKQFRRLLVRSYAATLAGYEGDAIEYKSGEVSGSGRKATVRTEIFPANGPSVPIHYTMNLYDGKWRMADVRIDGMSLVTNHRANFNEQIKAGGLDLVIEQLHEHNVVDGNKG